jgi:hypothetical protein
VVFIKKLKEVVASNFIEIAKSEEEIAVPSTTKAMPEIDRAVAPSYMETAPPVVSLPRRQETPIETVVVTKEPDSAPIEETPVEAIVSHVAAVASSLVKSEPEPVLPSPPPVATSRRSLLEIVAPNSPVDLEGIIREANLPSVPFVAEQAAKVLSALPADLPLQVKRLTVKATMEAVERDRTIDSQEIVADAMLKKGHLSNYREEFRAKVDALHRETELELAEVKAQIEREVARLQVEAERLNALKVSYDRKMRAMELATDERIAQMEQVIVFFQSEFARELDQQVIDRHNTEEEELPPFMRDDAVFRMLGLEKETAQTDDEGEASEEPILNGSTVKRSRSNRRRFAVAENVEP